jgi:hypothetical protein
MATKIEKLIRAVNDAFAEELRQAVTKKFQGLRVTTTLNLFAMALSTTRVDGKQFTEEQAAFIAAFEDGYVAALNKARGFRP